MKILQTHKVKNIKLAEVSNTLFKQFNYILQKLKEENAARKFNDTNIIAVPFMTSQTSDTISPNIETVCIGVIVSYDKTSAESYLTNILKSPDHIQDQKDYNDIGDQPVDFLDDAPQESILYEPKQDTIDDAIDAINGYLEYKDLKDDLHLLTTKNILEAKKQELDYIREEKIITVKDIS